MSFIASISSKPSVNSSWYDLIVRLSNNKVAVFISSALFPSPLLPSLTPNNIGEVTLCPTISFLNASSERYW